MRVSCDVTLQDFAALRKYIVQHSPFMAMQRRTAKITVGVIYGLVFVLSMLLLFIWFSGGVTRLWLLGIVVGGSVLSVAVGVFFNPAAGDAAQVEALHRTGELKSVLGQKTVEVTAETYICATEDTSVITRWRAIEQIVEGEQHIFTFYTPSSACIVPKRSFQSDDEMRAFVALAREYHEGKAPRST